MKSNDSGYGESRHRRGEANDAKEDDTCDTLRMVSGCRAARHAVASRTRRGALPSSAAMDTRRRAQRRPYAFLGEARELRPTHSDRARAPPWMQNDSYGTLYYQSGMSPVPTRTSETCLARNEACRAIHSCSPIPPPILGVCNGVGRNSCEGGPAWNVHLGKLGYTSRDPTSRRWHV